MQHFDLVVIGAGMVGAALALGAARAGKRVAIVESRLPTAFDPNAIPDVRVSAISWSSQALLADLGAWDFIAAQRVHPFSAISVWDTFGRTEFSAAEANLEHMGFMVENKVLQLGLHQALQECDDVAWFSAHSELSPVDGKVQLDGSSCVGDVIAAADGGNSKVRAQAGIGVVGWQYQQAVLGVTVRCEADPATADPTDMAETWQAFSPTGPKAFLPLMDGYASLIWYDTPALIRSLYGLTNQQLQERIAAAFPNRLPPFRILAKACFPIARSHAKRYHKQRLVLVGDAAHTINPLAGQGVNLGFKDVAALLAVLYPASAQAISSPGLSAAQVTRVLGHYQTARRPHNTLMMSAMDALYAVFSNDIAALKLARNIGLGLAANSGYLKVQVMRYAMGLT